MKSASSWALALTCVCGLVGCKPRDLAWQYRLDPTIDDLTAGLVAYIRDDTCGGTLPPVAAYRFDRGETPTQIASLPPGVYFVEIVALDSQCRPIGDGCEAVGLPTDQAAVVVEVERLGAPRGALCEPGAACADGVCVPTDAGP